MTVRNFTCWVLEQHPMVASSRFQEKSFRASGNLTYEHWFTPTHLILILPSLFGVPDVIWLSIYEQENCVGKRLTAVDKAIRLSAARPLDWHSNCSVKPCQKRQTFTTVVGSQTHIFLPQTNPTNHNFLALCVGVALKVTAWWFWVAVELLQCMQNNVSNWMETLNQNFVGLNSWWFDGFSGAVFMKIVLQGFSNRLNMLAVPAVWSHSTHDIILVGMTDRVCKVTSWS